MACQYAGLRVPVTGRKRVNAITAADVMRVLLPIWSTKRETASRGATGATGTARQRILDYSLERS